MVCVFYDPIFEIRAIRAVVLLGNPHYDNVVLIFIALLGQLCE